MQPDVSRCPNTFFAQLRTTNREMCPDIPSILLCSKVEDHQFRERFPDGPSKLICSNAEEHKCSKMFQPDALLFARLRTTDMQFILL